MVDDYDSPWKEAIERYFADFLHFFFPQAHASVDWSRPPVFLDQELRAVIRDAEAGKRFVDKLVRVNQRSGGSEWLYVHIEVQGDARDEFAERMFTYHYRLYDRYRQPIASLALLVDDRPDWRPDSFRYQSCGCQLSLRFPVAKLLDWRGSEDLLEDSPNPFAVVTHAHLATRATRTDMPARKTGKWRLVQGLYRRGWGRQKVVDLFKIIDWMMRLPPELEQQLRQDVSLLEREVDMPYLTSIERFAIERGFEQGMQQGMQQGVEQGVRQGTVEGRREGKRMILARQLVLRFGEPPEWATRRLQAASEEELDAWTDAVLSADSIEAIFGPSAH